MEGPSHLLKTYFSSSQRHLTNSNYNPAQLVLFAEHAAKNCQVDIAIDCLQIYFSLSPPSDQFYIRAHLCDALITAPTSPGDKAGLSRALGLLVEATNIAKESECYHYLVYNASVLFWYICEPYRNTGMCHHFARPLQAVVNALDECRDQDYMWRLELLVGLIHSQMDAGCKDDAIRTCTSAINLAKKRAPSKLMEVLKLQAAYNLGETKKEVETFPESSSLIYQLHKYKGIIRQQRASSETEQKLHKAFVSITDAHDVSLPRDSQMSLLLELGILCMECSLAGIAQECVQAMCYSELTQSPKLLFIRESLICQLNVASCCQGDKEICNSKINSETQLKTITKVMHLLTFAKKLNHFDLIQYICVVLWNVSFPLLHRDFRKLLLNPLNEAANALRDINSGLFQLRSNLHFEISKIAVEHNNLQLGLKHVEESLALEFCGEHREEVNFFRKQVVLCTQFYEVPSSSLHQAAVLVKQATVLNTVKELRPMLIKAGELILPICFTAIMDSIAVQNSNMKRLNNYENIMWQIKDSMITSSDENDEERFRLLTDIVKTARVHCIWDVAFITAQSCVQFHDGRWKALKHESIDQDQSIKIGIEDERCNRLGRTQMIRMLAEVHYILGECLINYMQDVHNTLDPKCSAVVIDDILKNFLCVAQLGGAIKEMWLVHNAAASLWNFSRHPLAISNRTFIDVLRKLLPIVKQMDLGCASILGMLICLALSGKLAGKWAPALQVSETKVHNGDTSTKTSKQTQIKKVGDDSSNQKEEQDSKGGPELAEALEVCEYAMATYCDIPLDIYRKLLVVWVRCKQLLHQPISTKTFGIEEGRDVLCCRAIVALEMIDLNGSGTWNFCDCPTLLDIVTLLTGCQWKDDLIEMELWSKLAGIALKQQDYKLVHLSCSNINILHQDREVGSQDNVSSVANMLQSVASSLKGQSLSLCSDGNLTTTRNALQSFLDSARFGLMSCSYQLVMKSCYHYWNTCLPFIANTLERCLLCESMHELVSLAAKSIERRKKQHKYTGEDNSIVKALYEVTFQAFAEKQDWEKGLQAIEEAISIMPKDISRHFFKYKIMFKSRMKKSIEADMLRFQEHPVDFQASLWYWAARNTTSRIDGLKFYRNAIGQLQLYHDSDHSWQKVEYLINFSEWLYREQFPIQDALNSLLEVADVILSMNLINEMATAQDCLCTLPLDASNLNIRQLETLLRVHVMMSLLTMKGSRDHKQLLSAASGFCIQIWNVIYMSLRDYKNTGLSLPATTIEWALYQIPEQLLDGTKSTSCDRTLNKYSIKKPVLFMHYLGLLTESLIQIGMDTYAIPILHLQILVAHIFLACNKLICHVLHMRLGALCRSLGLPSTLESGTGKAYNLKIPDSKEVARSYVEIEQYCARETACMGLKSKCVHKDIEEITLSHIWTKQAFILIAQGEYQDAHDLLNLALESCQIFKDNNTMFRVLCGLTVLAQNGNARKSSIKFLSEALGLSCNFEHWLDGILLVAGNLTIDGVDDQILNLLEYAISVLRFLKEAVVKDNVAITFCVTVLATRIKLIKQIKALMSQQPSLKCSVLPIDEVDVLRRQGHCIESARILYEQAQFYFDMAERTSSIYCLEIYHECLLKALKLYEMSISAFYDIYKSSKYLWHTSENMNPSIQRHLTDALLRASEVSLVIFKKYSNARVHSQVKLWQNSSDSEVANDLYVNEMPMRSVTKEARKTTAMLALERILGILSTAHFFAQGDTSFRSKCAFSVGHCLYLLARHTCPDQELQWTKTDAKIDKIVTRNSSKDSLRELMQTEVQKKDDKNEVNEKLSSVMLSQSCHSLIEAMKYDSSIFENTLRAKAALTMFECCGKFDPNTSSSYLALYQSLITSLKLKDSITKTHSNSRFTQLGSLLLQNDRNFKQNMQFHMQATTGVLQTYELYRRLLTSDNHLDLLKNFPVDFRFIIFQHSPDGSQLFTAYLIPPQPPLPVSKKGQPLQQSVSLEPVISRTDVSPEDFATLQKTNKEFMHLVSVAPISQESDEQFTAIVMIMEQYFIDALTTVAEALSKENVGSNLYVVLLANDDVLQLPLEALHIFRHENIVSVSRDISIQMLNHKIMKFKTDEEGKEKKKVDKFQPPLAIVNSDVSNLKYMLGPRSSSNLTVEPHDALDSVAKLISNNKVKWTGYSLPEHVLSFSEWCALLKDASGLLFVARHRLLTYYPACHLTTMNLQKCDVALLLAMQSNESARYSSKSLPDFEEYLPSVMILSLVGVRCIVVNQLPSNTCALSIIQDHTMGECDTTGLGNWNRVKKDLTDVDREKVHVVEEKQLKAEDYSAAIYGLPHINLLNT